MKNFIGRLASAVVLAGATMAVAAPSLALADPPANCEPGQYWDAYSNKCRPVGEGPALNCPAGQYWDPTTNVCRELGHTAAG